METFKSDATDGTGLALGIPRDHAIYGEPL
jgi:hypothetical protein